MAVSKNCWISILIALSTFNLHVCKCESWTFEIERFQPSKYDVVPNDFEINAQGHWVKLRKCQKSCLNSTTGFNTNNWQCPSRKKCCNCGCPYSHSTFRMGATARSSFCVKNEVLRSDAGCEFFFQSQGSTKSSAIPVLDLEDDDDKYVIKPPPGINQGSCRCHIVGSAQYWHAGEWKKVSEADLFRVINSNQNYFKWKQNDNYEGRIMRQSLQCNDTQQGLSSTSCIVFKVLGTLQYTVNNNPQPTTMQPLSSSKGATTKKPNTTPTTAGVTTHQTTSQILTTTTSSVQSTTVTQSTHATTTSQVETTAPIYHTPTPETQYSTRPDATTTEKIPTEASEMPTTKVTEKSTTETDVVPGKKGARGASSDSDSGDNTLVIAAIGATAAIACVIIICIFLWFVVKRKQNNRNNEAYSTDMTVITNGTGMNNASSAPTLKNPIYDNAAYCEPTEKHHPKQLPMLGNPVYDKAIVNNNNNKGHQNIKKQSHKPKTRKDSNHYDNKDEEEAYENPAYQDLVVKRVKNTPNNGDYSDSTYDNTYAEPEKPVYEALSADNGRDSIYQPLVHNIKSTGMESPEYLALLNENTSPGEQEMPEYLSLVGDESKQTQAETGDYDYAYVDGQEKRTTLKAPNTRGAGMSQVDPQVYNGPNDQGPPLYDVLEDPSDQGPPVYDVLEDPSDQGPPVYDVLEDPSDQGPPVYDVLEGPDSGDDYLMPVEGK